MLLEFCLMSVLRILSVAEFRSHEDMKRAIRKLDDREVDGHRVLIREVCGRIASLSLLTLILSMCFPFPEIFLLVAPLSVPSGCITLWSGACLALVLPGPFCSRLRRIEESVLRCGSFLPFPSFVCLLVDHSGALLHPPLV